MLRPLKRDKPATRTLKDNWLRTEREERLWQALRVWRMKQAEAEGIPAYMIFGDKTLRDLVEKCRKTSTGCTTSTAWAKPKPNVSDTVYSKSAKTLPTLATMPSSVRKPNANNNCVKTRSLAV